MLEVLPAKKIRRAFNKAAHTYARAQALPNEIGQRLLQHLDLMQIQPTTILELGCATGYLTRALAQRYPRARVLSVDLAHTMLVQAKRRLRWRSRTYCINTDAHALPLAAHSVDLIFANLTLAWCYDAVSLFAELKRVLKPRGLLLFSTLGPDTLRELKQSWATVDNTPHVHSFTDMHDLGDQLVQTKFAEPVMDMENLTVHYVTLEKLLQDLKNLGMHNLSARAHKGLTTPAHFAKFKQAYAQHCSAQKWPATFEIIYGHAWSPEFITATADQTGVAVFPIAQLTRKSI